MAQGPEEHPDRVPGAEDAQADLRKFQLYLLNETHPRGAGKAKFFRMLGFNAEDLRDRFLDEVPRVAGRFSRENAYGGANYEAVIRVQSTSGRTYHVNTFWEVGETGTKFLTAYPGEADKVEDEGSES